MEIFNFVKWQWNRFPYYKKSIIIMAISAIASIPAMLYVGFNLVISVGMAFVVFALIGSLAILGDVVRDQWAMYVTVKEAEAGQIMRKLRG